MPLLRVIHKIVLISVLGQWTWSHLLDPFSSVAWDRAVPWAHYEDPDPHPAAYRCILLVQPTPGLAPVTLPHASMIYRHNCLHAPFWISFKTLLTREKTLACWNFSYVDFKKKWHYIFSPVGTWWHCLCWMCNQSTPFEHLCLAAQALLSTQWRGGNGWGSDLAHK